MYSIIADVKSIMYNMCGKNNVNMCVHVSDLEQKLAVSCLHMCRPAWAMGAVSWFINWILTPCQPHRILKLKHKQMKIQNSYHNYVNPFSSQIHKSLHKYKTKHYTQIWIFFSLQRVSPFNITPVKKKAYNLQD